MLLGDVPPPSSRVPALPAALDAVVLRATSPIPEARFATAREMRAAMERALPVATPSEVGAWVQRVAAGELAARAARVADVERRTATPLTADAAIAWIGASEAPPAPPRSPRRRLAL